MISIIHETKVDNQMREKLKPYWKKDVANHYLQVQRMLNGMTEEYIIVSEHDRLSIYFKLPLGVTIDTLPLVMNNATFGFAMHMINHSDLAVMIEEESKKFLLLVYLKSSSDPAIYTHITEAEKKLRITLLAHAKVHTN